MTGKLFGSTEGCGRKDLEVDFSLGLVQLYEVDPLPVEMLMEWEMA